MIFPTLSCQESARLMAAELERRLTWWERLKLRLHLRVCDLCQRYQVQLQFIDRLLGRADAIKPDERLSAEARQRIRQRLEQEEAS